MAATHSPQLLLASSSPRRSMLLAQAGFHIDQIQAPEIDETPLKKELPAVYAARMASKKNECAIEQYQKGNLDNENVVIIAADTVVACGRRILPKAETREQAEECLRLLSGRSHRVYSAVSISSTMKGKEAIVTQTTMTRVTFKRLSLQEIEYYLNSKEWQGKAGGYAIQSMAESYVRRINGSYSNIVGLPLYNTVNLLRQYGIAPDLRHE